jgi:HD-GYP domain-containing protein (c-di-GMP phosphodiesterase class II)
MEEDGMDAFIRHYLDRLEERDRYTKEHSHHVMITADAIHRCLPGGTARDVGLADLRNAALLHDIGKLFVPFDVLNKGGGLDGDEWDQMRLHPMRGKDFVENTSYGHLGEWILYHHERMDGSGYYGLRGDAIPLAARIIAVADTFSALRTYRVYRPAKSIDETIEVLRGISGTQLDRDIVELFLSKGRDALRSLQRDSEYYRKNTRIHFRMRSGAFRRETAHQPV